eukprot:scaffold1295_cov220-Pinguiococcus_pyrenoidosus.AAC.13
MVASRSATQWSASERCPPTFAVSALCHSQAVSCSKHAWTNRPRELCAHPPHALGQLASIYGRATNRLTRWEPPPCTSTSKRFASWATLEP